MTELNKLIVHSKGKLAFEMTLQPDGSYKTIYGPGFHQEKKKRPKTGPMAALRRKHKKWVNR